MTKKQFTHSFQDIFSPTVVQPKPNQMEDKGSKSRLPLVEDENKRTTLLLSKSTYDDIRAIAHWERCLIRDLLTRSLNAIIESYTPEELSTIRRQFSQRGHIR